ncbi:expressed unknown protein [Seminavis robusta]|uniref:Uncharacterized protein n=1 Tax=Seminavis robusta TaxID=568900 RepID=A0A9N8DB54_9STRA|nr:expressed unknown protein [Seminavis robusta]|eukprot:Sro68_g038200.1 n/a (299) ;mRNA; f:85995-86891
MFSLALQNKRSAKYDIALSLYIQAHDLDPFNHLYYHHRGEAWLSAVQHFNRLGNDWCFVFLGHAGLDAQRSLDLAPRFDLPWLTLVMAPMVEGNLDNAQRNLDVALDNNIVTEEQYAYKILLDYKNRLEQMQANPMRMPLIHHVAFEPERDPYYFAYSNGFHNYGRQPELLAVDLEMARGVSHGKKIMFWVAKHQLGGAFDMELGDAYEYPKEQEEKCWVLPIPVKTEEIRKGLLPLLDVVQPASRITLLRAVYCNQGEEKPLPLTEAEANAYLQSIVNNAERPEELYAQGKKLACEL